MTEVMKKVAVIGLGYVGLPLAVEFGKKRPTLGFDIDSSRIAALCKGVDYTNEINEEELRAATQLEFTDNIEQIRAATIYIVTVPTPINKYNRPDLTPLISASRTVGRVLKTGDIVIYESTVYPGATEGDCVPVLEQESGLKYNIDFFVGYSPERINPGDRKHRLPNICKITSGSTPDVAKEIDALYGTIIEAGTHQATTIQVAEAAKVIENTQRDVNIALINEFTMIFRKLGIDTQEVLDAASTKWNFLPFKPGLVGGHCIGVDPFYLTHKAEEIGYHPEMILSGRRINDNMSFYVALEMLKLLAPQKNVLNTIKLLILGVTFKANCPDIRNTKIADLYNHLREFGLQVDICDPWASPMEVKEEYKLDLVTPRDEKYDGVLVAVDHEIFVRDPEWDAENFVKSNGIVFDIKSVYPSIRGFHRL